MGLPYTRCGACIYNRRKCIDGCFLAPYFQYLGSSMDYAAVHRIFEQRNFISLIAKIFCFIDSSLDWACSCEICSFKS